MTQSSIERDWFLFKSIVCLVHYSLCKTEDSFSASSISFSSSSGIQIKKSEVKSKIRKFTCRRKDAWYTRPFGQSGKGQWWSLSSSNHGSSDPLDRFGCISAPRISNHLEALVLDMSLTWIYSYKEMSLISHSPLLPGKQKKWPRLTWFAIILGDLCPLKPTGNSMNQTILNKKTYKLCIIFKNLFCHHCITFYLFNSFKHHNNLHLMESRELLLAERRESQMQILLLSFESTQPCGTFKFLLYLYQSWKALELGKKNSKMLWNKTKQIKLKQNK